MFGNHGCTYKRLPELEHQVNRIKKGKKRRLALMIVRMKTFQKRPPEAIMGLIEREDINTEGKVWFKNEVLLQERALA